MLQRVWVWVIAKCKAHGDIFKQLCGALNQFIINYDAMVWDSKEFLSISSYLHYKTSQYYLSMRTDAPNAGVLREIRWQLWTVVPSTALPFEN